MTREFQRGDRVRVIQSASRVVWVVVMRPHELNDYRLRLATDDGHRYPCYTDPANVELVESVEERVAQELMA